MHYSFDTSAFLPTRGRTADAYRNQWQRYTLVMTDEQYTAMLQRHATLVDDSLRSGRAGRLRAYERIIVQRFGV